MEYARILSLTRSPISREGDDGNNAFFFFLGVENSSR